MDKPGRGGLPGPGVSRGRIGKRVQMRVSDLRTADGRALAQVINAITADLGGPDQLSAAQTLIIGNLRAKIIIIQRISAFLDTKLDLLDANGDLPGCLGGNGFLAYSEAVRRDLESLYKLANRERSTRIASLNDILAESDAKIKKLPAPGRKPGDQVRRGPGRPRKAQKLDSFLGATQWQPAANPRAADTSSEGDSQ